MSNDIEPNKNICVECDSKVENHCHRCKRRLCYSHAFVVVPVVSEKDIVKTIDLNRLTHRPASRSKATKKTARPIASLLQLYDKLIANEPNPKYKDYEPNATPFKVFESSEWQSNEIAIYADEAPQPIKGEQDTRYKKLAITLYDSFVFFDDINLKTYDRSKLSQCQNSFVYCKNCLPQNIDASSYGINSSSVS